jgi:hypothetical protein
VLPQCNEATAGIIFLRQLFSASYLFTGHLFLGKLSLSYDAASLVVGGGTPFSRDGTYREGVMSFRSPTIEDGGGRTP